MDKNIYSHCERREAITTYLFIVIAKEGERSQPIYSHCEGRGAIATYL
ncbi:hypothetical protein [Aphanizomenon sp. UHCC 0183]|nr:hypothetical protein [Aphanizomenon sp. UHCC 0183]